MKPEVTCLPEGVTATLAILEGPRLGWLQRAFLTSDQH